MKLELRAITGNEPHRQPGDQVLGETVGEMFLLWIARQIVERQDRNGRPAAEARNGVGLCRLRRGHCRRRSRTLAQLVADISRGLDAAARVLLQAPANGARQIARQLGADLGQRLRVSRRIDEAISADESPVNGRCPLAIS
jgi:hypothetical protein